MGFSAPGEDSVLDLRNRIFESASTIFPSIEFPLVTRLYAGSKIQPRMNCNHTAQKLGSSRYLWSNLVLIIHFLETVLRKGPSFKLHFSITEMCQVQSHTFLDCFAWSLRFRPLPVCQLQAG